MKPARLILFVIMLLVAALVIGEGALRLYFAVAKDPPDSRYVSDPDCGYRLRPGPFWEDGSRPEDIVNSFGFRDREHDLEKPPGVFRIVGIGDSFVLGAVPIEENFLRIAERNLNEVPIANSLATEMIMMGLGGYGPRNELGVLRGTAIGLQPDLVVLCFFIGNDITGIPLQGEVLGGEMYFVRSSNRWHNLLRKSRLFVLTEKVIVTKWRLRNLRDVAEDDDAGKQEDTSTPTVYYLLIQKKRLPVYERDPEPDMQELWSEAESILREFDRECRQASIPWLLMLIPAEEQVSSDVREKVWDELSVDAGSHDIDAPQRRLIRFARASGIEVLDLLPTFRVRHEAGDRLYIPNDTHWNESGNRLAGEVLSRYVRSLSPQPDDASAQ